MTKNIVVITGPSGVGKTTLQNLLQTRLSINPLQCVTTRGRRKDDNPNEIICVSNEEFDISINKNIFFFYSGDSYRYGYLIPSDDYNVHSFVTSYRDLPIIFSKTDYNVFSIVLAFENLEKNMRARLIQRGSSLDDIEMRIKFAKEDRKNNFEYARKNSNLTIYTDITNVEDTYTLVKNQIYKSSELKKSLILKRC